MPSIFTWFTQSLLPAFMVLVSLGVSAVSTGLQTTPGATASLQPFSTPPNSSQSTAPPASSTYIQPCEVCANKLQPSGNSAEMVCGNNCPEPATQPNPDPTPQPQPQPAPFCPPCSEAPGHMICPMIACRIE